MQYSKERDYISYPVDAKTKQLQYISSFAAIGIVPAIKPYLPHALRAGATKEEILSTYLNHIPSGGLVHALPALKEMSDYVDNILDSSPVSQS